jgi:hypothetical protein
MVEHDFRVSEQDSLGQAESGYDRVDQLGADEWRDQPAVDQQVSRQELSGPNLRFAPVRDDNRSGW